MTPAPRIVHPVGRPSHLPHLTGVLEAADNAGVTVDVVVWNPDLLEQVRALAPATAAPRATLRRIVTEWLQHLPHRVTTIGRVDDDVQPSPNLLTQLHLGQHDAVCAWPYTPPAPDYPTAVCMGAVHLAHRAAVTFRYPAHFPAWTGHVDARWQGHYTLRPEPSLIARTPAQDRPAPIVEAEMRQPRRHPWP